MTQAELSRMARVMVARGGEAALEIRSGLTVGSYWDGRRGPAHSGSSLRLAERVTSSRGATCQTRSAGLGLGWQLSRSGSCPHARYRHIEFDVQGTSQLVAAR